MEINPKTKRTIIRCIAIVIVVIMTGIAYGNLEMSDIIALINAVKG